MQKTTLIRLTALASFALLCAPPPALAVSKEMIQLQTQVQQLQDMLQHLQQSNDERMGVLQHLVEQTADNVNRMTAQMDSLNKAVKDENDATSAKVDGVSGQTQNLNDSVDELKSRIAKLDKQLQDIQAQLQNLNSPAQLGATGANGAPATPLQGVAPAAQPPQAQAPPVEQLYQSGLRDYNTARYDIASSEFSDVLKFYPQDDLAGNAQFYIGEIAYRQAQYPDAIKAYDAVIEQYSGNNKVPAAQLRKGEALIATNRRDAGVLELRSLIQRHPQTPEAQQARSRLNALGVRIVATKPTPYR